jgi:formate-dependent nitrite reductase membrane component NrfD
MINLFFSWELIKFFTLGIIAAMLIAVPFVMRKIERALPQTLAPLYRKYAADTYVQTVLFLLPIFLAAYSGIRTNNLTNAITLAFLSICLFGGLLSLWNARKSWVEIEVAIKGSTDTVRLKKLENIKSMAKIIILASLLSTITGLVGLIFVFSVEKQPSWFWFLAFLMTMQPISSRPWSVSILTVASKYANDLKFGVEANLR